MGLHRHQLTNTKIGFMRFYTKLYYYNMHTWSALKGVWRVVKQCLPMGWRKGSKSSAMNQSRLQRIQKWQSWGRLESQQTYRTKAAHSRTCTGSWSSNLSPVSNGVTQQACHGEHEGRGQERERVPARRRWLRGRASRAGSFTRHSTYVADKR